MFLYVPKLDNMAKYILAPKHLKDNFCLHTIRPILDGSTDNHFIKGSLKDLKNV